jgi:hypothetical protein
VPSNPQRLRAHGRTAVALGGRIFPSEIAGAPTQRLAHECIHWTRHPTRLDRDFGRKRWATDPAAFFARE